MQALIRHFDPQGLISGGLRLGSRYVLQVSRRMSIDCAGRERVAIAHSTWWMLVGSRSSSTTMTYLPKYAPAVHCAASAITCAAWPAYICLIETTVMPQPAASGIDHTPLIPGTPSFCRSAQIPAERNAAQNSPASLAAPSAIKAQVNVGLSR